MQQAVLDDSLICEAADGLQQPEATETSSVVFFSVDGEQQPDKLSAFAYALRSACESIT